MFNWVPVALGGALGSVSRYYLATNIYHYFSRNLSYGILTCNVIGSFLIGLAAIVITTKLPMAPIWRYAIMVGFLGGFTTFSSFSLDTVQLFQQGAWQRASLYIASSLVLCLLATLIGLLLGNKLIHP